jgi:oligopeptide/dipeptide ABC transporter ATP-binding protein
VLAIRDLRTYFHVPERDRLVRAVDGVSLTVNDRETLAVVGESGSGKSATMLTVLGLLTSPPGVVTGRVLYKRPGEPRPVDLLEGLERFARFTPGPPARVEKDDRGWRRWLDAQLRDLRGRELAMIFQSPRSSLHPHFTVGQQLLEAIRRRSPWTRRRKARSEAAEWLARVHIDAPRKRLADYPHSLSGGMCQRVMIAMALAARPVVLIADEPTTGLDATVGSRVLDLMEEMKSELGTTTIVITHDIGVARRLADRIAVMYAGRVVEVGPARDVLDPAYEPKHPYTRALLRSLPSVEDIRQRRRLAVIEGDVPDLSCRSAGCRFAERCGEKPEEHEERCVEEEPALEMVLPRHEVRCWRHHVKKPEVPEP